MTVAALVFEQEKGLRLLGYCPCCFDAWLDDVREGEWEAAS